MSTAEIALPQIKLRAGRASDLQSVCTYYLQECAVHVPYFLCCCFSCRHVAEKRFSDSFVSYKTSQWFGLA